MPVMEVTDPNGKLVGFRYGQMGKLYTVAQYGKAEAKLRALTQGRAIQQSQTMSGKPVT